MPICLNEVCVVILVPPAASQYPALLYAHELQPNGQSLESLVLACHSRFECWKKSDVEKSEPRWVGCLQGQDT